MSTMECTSGVPLPGVPPLDRLGLSASWFDVSPRPQDQACKGLFTSLLRLCDADGEQAGYVAVSFTTAGTIAAMSRSFWQFMDEWYGWSSVGADGAPSWERAHLCARRTPRSLARQDVGFWQLSASLRPDEATVSSDLEFLQRQLRADGWSPEVCMTDFLLPFVAFSRVEDAWRGRGLGGCMYVLAARQLATRGQVLAASVSRTPEAAALWARLEADVAVPTTTVRRFGKRLPAIDFR